MLQAFHNDQAVKTKYVNRVIAHQKADNLIRGQGWQGGKGCGKGRKIRLLRRRTFKNYQKHIEGE